MITITPERLVDAMAGQPINSVADATRLLEALGAAPITTDGSLRLAWGTLAVGWQLQGQLVTQITGATPDGLDSQRDAAWAILEPLTGTLDSRDPKGVLLQLQFVLWAAAALVDGHGLPGPMERGDDPHPFTEMNELLADVPTYNRDGERLPYPLELSGWGFVDCCCREAVAAGHGTWDADFNRYEMPRDPVAHRAARAWWDRLVTGMQFDILTAGLYGGEDNHGRP